MARLETLTALADNPHNSYNSSSRGPDGFLSPWAPACTQCTYFYAYT